MGRGEEFTRRKQNKSVRKRLRAETGDVNGIEGAAAKRRRRKGVRRTMEGMCYTLPTPENPFNEPDLRGNLKKRFTAPKPKPRSPKTASTNGKTQKTDLPPSESTGFRRSFWPIGSEGKKPLVGMRDPRLPDNFFSSYRSLFAPVGGGRFLEDSRFRDAFVAECWEGCLRGSDVLAAGTFQKSNEIILSNDRSSQRKSTEDGVGPSGVDFDLDFDHSVAYILPGLHHVKAQKMCEIGDGPVALFLVKNRVRAIAVRRLVKLLQGEGMAARSLSIHEGTSLERQVEGLMAQGAEIMVATPKRICELLKTEGLKFGLGRVTFLVVDDAHGILAENGSSTIHIKKIKSRLHPKCQSVLLSPKYPPNVCSLTQEVLKNPIFRAGSGLSVSAGCAGIKFEVSACTDETQRVTKLLKYVKKVQESEAESRVKSKILAVVDSPAGVERILKGVEAEKHKAASFDGNLDAEERVKVAENFRSGKVNILVIPKVELKSQDLQLSGVSIVLLEGLLDGTSDYTELISSIARKSTNGQVFCVFTPEMATKIPPLVVFLDTCNQPVPTKLGVLAQEVQRMAVQNQ